MWKIVKKKRKQKMSTTSNISIDLVLFNLLFLVSSDRFDKSNWYCARYCDLPGWEIYCIVPAMRFFSTRATKVNDSWNLIFFAGAQKMKTREEKDIEMQMPFINSRLSAGRQRRRWRRRRNRATARGITHNCKSRVSSRNIISPFLSPHGDFSDRIRCTFIIFPGEF